MVCRIGVDIGGTFTDLVLVDDAGAVFRVGKVLTTPADPAQAVEQGVRDLLASAGVPATAVSHIVHGTTLLTNALIERKGARTALLTTAGFRDALEIAREHRYDMYDLFMERPAPLVPRRLRYEVGERILDDGTIVRSLDLEEAGRVVEALRREGVEAVAVCLLHSYRNPAHERALGDLLRSRAPGVACSLSCEVVPEIREYERASTTVANVYVQPLAEQYLTRLGERLEALAVTGALFIMQSGGGICTAETARRFPVRWVESGPAAGALAASHYGTLGGRSNLLSFDMGGTTAKACLIENGRPLITPEFEVARAYRFKRGSGLPIKVPAIEMIEVGAGGGSIARVDRLGLLGVGPDSAGAEPGPACYGRGGSEPTVTDADVMLGYVDPDFFLGGRLRLDPDAARRAITERVARPLGMDPVRAAWGIHQVVNERMASAARIHAAERGKDLRRFPLFAFGGAGPVHAYRVAETLRCPAVICPLGAGVTSAVGFLAAPLSFDFVRTLHGTLEAMDWVAVNAALQEMEQEGREILEQAAPSGGPPPRGTAGRGSAGRPADGITFHRYADMRYQLQGYDIPVALPDGRLGPGSEPAIRQAFEQAYAAIYGRTVADAPVEVLSWRVVAEGPRPPLHLPKGPAGDAARPDAEEALRGRRSAYLPEAGGFADVPVYDRYRLAPGHAFAGPAIVEEHESTAVIGPRGRVLVDEWLNLVIDLGHGGEDGR